MTKTLILIRGLPGSGKSTLAETLTLHVGYRYETDAYFIQNGQYKFDSTKLSIAHKWNQNLVNLAMRTEQSPIVVSNTFTTNKEIKPYLEMAREHNYKVIVLHVESGLDPSALAKRNIHKVPVETIEKMKNRWEDYKRLTESVDNSQ